MPQNPNPSYYERIKYSFNTYGFFFKSLNDFNLFIEDKKSESLPNSLLRRNLQQIETQMPNELQRSGEQMFWYGVNNVSTLSQNLDTFLYRNDLDALLGNINGRISNINITDLDQKSVIKFTEQEVGIFSFDLASLGLIPVYEYYSPLLKEIVDSNKVKSYTNQVGTKIFYMEEQNAVPEHKVRYVEKYGGWYSDILKRVIPKKDLILIDTEFYYPEKNYVPRHDVERKNKLDKNGNKKYTTTFKKSFIQIIKTKKPLPRIDIIAPFSFNSSVSADEMKYNTLSAIKLAENLDKIGVNFRIIVAYPVQLQRDQNKIFQYIIVKSENEPLDKNKIAIFLGDARYYRYQRFRSIVTAADDINSTATVDSNWSTITDTREIKNRYIDYLRSSTNPIENDEATRPNTKLVLPVAQTEAAAIRAYENIINDIRNLI